LQEVQCEEGSAVMAVSLITKAWPIKMQTGRKFVLVALCDAANDDGACFLCVETIAYKCGLSVRAVQGHLVDLEAVGLVARDARPGRSSIYSVNVEALDDCEKHEYWVKRQRGYKTPAESAPPQKTADTPAESAPAPAESAPITITYPPLNGVEIPAWITPEDWSAFLAHRKAIKKPMTAEVQRRAIAKLDGLRQQGNDVHTMIDEAIINGWQSFYPPKTAANGRNQHGGINAQRANTIAALTGRHSNTIDGTSRQMD
jgi:DNA-binding transcriptional ArsR family regulator